MSFDNSSFWLFAAAVWVVCRLVSRSGRGNAASISILVAGSYAYYASWDPRYVLLLAGFTAFSFWIGGAVAKGARFRLMISGVAVCVAVLAAVKLWIRPLPVGVSFYALQAIAYIADRYRGDLAEPVGLLRYSLYMSFFPRLPAGPIVRAGDFLPQTAERPRLTSTDVWEALVLIVFGLFKKLVIADNLALVVDPVFTGLHAGAGRIMLATYAFAAQIYCDFAGYTDMALGVARLFGYRLPENFNWPYLARNPADFWRRWHISLSHWLRDYVYFALPGHRSKSRIYSYIHFPVTMLICGLWHGLGWMFALWGLYHGILLAAYYKLRPRAAARESALTLAGFGSILLMQQLTVIGWVLFRTNRLSDLPAYFAGLLRAPSFAEFGDKEWMAVALIVVVAVGHLIELAVPITGTAFRYRWNPWVLTGLLASLLATVTLNVPAQQLFFYFRF